MRQLLESWSTVHWLIAGGGLALLLAIVLFWWLVAGPGPRRRRGLRHAKRLLAQGNWSEVLKLVPNLRNIGRPNDAWQKSFNQIEGDALEAAAKERLDAKDYENALAYGLQAARTKEENPLEPRAMVQNAILAEARRLFATSTWEDSAPILDLLHRAIRIQSPCREASFWQALCLLRGGDVEQAMNHLHIARTGMERSVRDEDMPDDRSAPTSPILEPPLYLGALLLQQGKAKEALRYIAEANRLDASCPIVPLLLGCGMIAAGGDVALAVKTLQRAVAKLLSWTARPTAFWAEVYPETRSYVRKLAVAHPFHCPLWGDNAQALLRQGQLALAQGLQRQGQDKEAVELFDKVLKDGAPSGPVLRGQGLALARLGRFDEAYKSLRLAYDAENPKDRLTTGYLALCAAKAKPAQATDVAQNLAWAVKALTPFSAPGDAEWVNLISQVFTEARAANIPLALDDQLYLCEHLTSINATDASAAAAYAQIHAEHPQMVRHEYAWLYAQAVTAHDEIENVSLPLLDVAIHDRAAAQSFFENHKWPFEAVERMVLTRSANLRPGRLPESLGPDALARAEALLLEGSREREAAGDLDAARALVETFSRLVPHHPAALDRLSALHHRAGRHAQSIAALIHWQQRFPQDPLPLVRLGLVRSKADEISESLELLNMAHNLAQGPARAQIALLAARLALQHWSREGPSSVEASQAVLPTNETSAVPLAKDAALARAEDFLNRALADDPANEEAVAYLVALRWVKNDEHGMASLADRCRGFKSTDPRHYYFGALAMSAAKDWAGVVAACRMVTQLVADKNGSLGALAIEAAYLEGIAQSELGDNAAAAQSLQKPANAEASPSAPFAQGLLGAVLLQQGQFEAASNWWQKLPNPQRTAWKIGEILGGTQMLAALEAFQAGRFELAADKFRQAGKLGCRDRRLGGLMLASLVKAGKQAVYGKE